MLRFCRPTLASKTILAFHSSNQNRGDNPMKSAWSHSCLMDIVDIVDTVDTVDWFPSQTWGVFHHQTWYVTMWTTAFPRHFLFSTSVILVLNYIQPHKLCLPLQPSVLKLCWIHRAPRRVVIGANGSKQWGNACDVARLVSLFWQRTTPLNELHPAFELHFRALTYVHRERASAASAFSQPLSEVFIQVPLKALTRQEEQRKPPTHRSVG